MTVTIADVNEQPMVTRSSGTGDFSIAENSGTTVGDFDATDPEGHAVTWSLASGGDSRFFEIDETNGALSFKKSEFNENEIPDYESTGLGSDKAYNVTVRATEVDDGDTQTRRAEGPPRRDRQCDYLDVNEAPTSSPGWRRPPDWNENTTGNHRHLPRHGPRERVAVTWSLQDRRRRRVHDQQRGGALVRKRPQLRGQVLVHGDRACIRRAQQRLTTSSPSP